MKHGSLFSGIGGFDLAAEWIGWENVFQVEIDEFCNKVLKKHFSDTKRYKDIYEFDGTKYRGTIDIISGGFPCQPFSQAGKRQGTKDDRYLWPEMLRVISEIKPAFVVGENVIGLLSMENGKTLERIFADLENEGYEIESFIIPACSIGAWHRRDRIWIIAYNESINKRGLSKRKKKEKPRFAFNNQDAPNTSKDRQRFLLYETKNLSKKEREQGRNISNKNTSKNWWTTEPKLGRVAHGIPNRVDRLKGLGNAIVPQIAFEIFKAMDKLF